MMLIELVAVAAGGALGSVARYLVGRVINEHITGVFPWSTLVVNVSGCFLIGLLCALISRNEGFSEVWRLFLVVGFCGGFTTFSTFANENYLLFDAHRLGIVALYAGLSLALGLIAVYSGYAIGRR